MTNTLHSKTPHFPWPGGKATLASTILGFAPTKGRKFIDLFAGRGNLLFYAISNGFEFDEFIVNDIQTASFFRAIKNHGGKFTAGKKSPEELDRCIELAKQGDPYALMMMPWLCFNGGTYEANGLRGGGGGRRKPESHTRAIRLAHKLLNKYNVRITQLDWLDCLQAENLGPNDFVAVDPPYIGANVGCYEPDSISPIELIDHLQFANFSWVFCEYAQPIYVNAFGEPAFTKTVQRRAPNVQQVRKTRTECVWVHKAGSRPNVTVTVHPVPEDRTQVYYTELSVPELLDEIKACIGSVTFSRNQMNREMRLRLLPVLLELRKRTFRKNPGYQDCLRQIGLNADTVRQWFYRGKHADDAIEMIDPEPEEPVGTPGNGKSATEELLEQAEKMAKVLLADKIIHAKKLATEFLEARSGV